MGAISLELGEGQRGGQAGIMLSSEVGVAGIR